MRPTLLCLRRKRLFGVSVGFYKSPFEKQLRTRLKFKSRKINRDIGRLGLKTARIEMSW